MFFYELQEDEREVVAKGAETPFTFAVHERHYRNEAEMATRLRTEVESASTFLAMRGVKGARADGARGRLWTDREASGEAFMLLLDQYRVSREQGLVIVEVM